MLCRFSTAVTLSLSFLICCSNLVIINASWIYKPTIWIHIECPFGQWLVYTAFSDPSTFPLTNLPCGPLGMVLVRTELGQLVMVPQQALAQVQAQAQAQAQNSISPRPATPTTGASFRVTTPQVRHGCRPLVLAATYTLSSIATAHSINAPKCFFYDSQTKTKREKWQIKKLWYLIPATFLALCRDVPAFCMCQRTSLHVCLMDLCVHIYVLCYTQWALLVKCSNAEIESGGHDFHLSKNRSGFCVCLLN